MFVVRVLTFDLVFYDKKLLQEFTYLIKKWVNIFLNLNKQCCGSGSAWIRIKLKGRIRIPIKVICWIRIQINFQMTSQNVWNMSLFEHFFKVLSFCLKARIRIRIKVTSRIRIRVQVMRIRNTVYKDVQAPEKASRRLLILWKLILPSLSNLFFSTRIRQN